MSSRPLGARWTRVIGLARRLSRGWGPVALFAAVAMISPTVAAEEDAAVTRARELAIEGLVAFDAGRYPEALEKLTAAHAEVPLPTLALYRARALVQLGRVVEAAASYAEAIRLDVTRGDRATQEQAREDAARERAALLPTIPRLQIAVDGALATDATVRVDGVVVPAATLAAGYLVDPGTRDITVSCPGSVRRTTATVEMGERDSVTIACAAPAPPEPDLLPNGPTAPEPREGARWGPGARSAAWLGIGIGGAGLIAGGVTGIAAIDRRAWLRDQCPNDECEPPVHDDVDAYRNLRVASSVGFVFGGTAVVSGVALLLAYPRRPEAARRVTPLVGLGQVGARGRF